MSTWTITTGATTKTMEEWAIPRSSLTRQRGGPQADVVRFEVFADLETDAPFAQWSDLTIKQDGTTWFVGKVANQPRRCGVQSERIAYEVHGLVWWDLENTPFQQMWVTIDPDGTGSSTLTTTRSNVILGQSLDGTKMHSGDVMREVLIYALYAAKGVAFPDTVGTDHLPAVPGGTPWQIGTITPDIVVPYSQVRDRKCADIIRLLLKYSPDAVTWTDYTTTPPTFHIGQRGGLTGKTIPVTAGAPVVEFNATPRADLQVPVVIVKFEQTNTRDNATFDEIVVQQYPTGVLPNTRRAWVQTIDLLGGQVTFQHQDVVTVARPIAYTDSGALDWALAHESWLLQKNDSGSDVWDKAHIDIAYIATTLDSSDPLNTSNPLDIPSDLHTLVNELVGGGVADWMQDQGIVAALGVVECWFKYTGSDDATKKLFWFNPAAPSVPLSDGTGYLIRYIKTKVTNASTTTYSQLTDAQAAEPVPEGYAEKLYNALAQLHFEGTLTLQEDECSDPLPPGCTFNTSDGRDEWKTMDALVMQVQETIETGRTEIRFGPPVIMGLDTLEELYRANLGRLPSFKLDQRTTGKAGGGARVKGINHTPFSSSTGPSAPPGSSDPYPFQVSSRYNSTSGTKQILVRLDSTLYTTPSRSSNLTITGLNTWIDVSGTGWVYLKGSVDTPGYTVDGDPTILTANAGGDYAPDDLAWNAGAFVEWDEDNQPFQLYFRVLIANYDATGAGAPTINQKLKNHLLLTNTTFDGIAAIYPFPLAT